MFSWYDSLWKVDWDEMFFSKVSFFLFIIFIVYTMLPVGMKDAVIAGIVASLSHIIVLSIYLSMGHSSHSQLAVQVSLPIPSGQMGYLWHTFSNRFFLIYPSIVCFLHLDFLGSLQEIPCYISLITWSPCQLWVTQGQISSWSLYSTEWKLKGI